MKIDTNVPHSQRKNVVLTNVSNGSVLQGRDKIVYAEVRDADDDTLLVSATLEDILSLAAERGYYFVSKEKHLGG